MLSKMAKKILFLFKTGIFYEFSKWREIAIRKPITEPQNLPKGNGSSVIRDVKPGLRQASLRFACCDFHQSWSEPKQCLRNVLFLDVATFETKRKGYCFIPYPFTVKLSPKSKNEGKGGSILWNRNELIGNQPSIRPCVLSTSQRKTTPIDLLMIWFRGWREMKSVFVFFRPSTLVVFWTTKLQINLKVSEANERWDISQHEYVCLSKQAVVYFVDREFLSRFFVQ